MSDFQTNRPFTPSNTPHLYSGGPYLRYSLPPPIMPGEQTRTLWCLVDPDHAPAPVRVPDISPDPLVTEYSVHHNKILQYESEFMNIMFSR
jgi:hypothetical protein